MPHYNDVRTDSLPSLHELTDHRTSDSLCSEPPALPDLPPIDPENDPIGSKDNGDSALDIKPVHRFFPDTWKNFFRSSSGSSKLKSMLGSSSKNTTTDGVPCSPPPSPSVPGSYRDQYGGSGGSYNSRKEREAMLLESIDGHTVHTALTYSEKVEEYNQRYAYMKSWAGLLRILGCVELLLGAAIFACVCAYIHKDNEWYNIFGYSQPGGFYSGGYSGSYGGGAYGNANYTGPKTPFILVVAGLAWIVTIIILVLGMTMYYRTILLDSSWWPLTEFFINLTLAVLFLAAGCVYVNDTTRGGLCSYQAFNNGINGAFCRTDAGQTAAIIFLFFIMIVYLVGAIVCLKLWRHEVARRLREQNGQEMQPKDSPVANHLVVDGSREPMPVSALVQHTATPAVTKPRVVKGHIPAGHAPKPVIMPDYIAKYPAIRTDEQRDQYKAVFNDQYSEYKELHAEVQAILKKFDEMDVMMQKLPQNPTSHTERDHINKIRQEYQRKKMDPSFLEKKERCEYLKNKLAHIKQRIHEFDKVMGWNDGYG
ncbi:MARVEL domain-containing protein 2-like isoform X1 [Carassius auratus]|uniref:MARVEL domain-containing protein 2-like isoform X1 n=1 Tax=Carassius auratus TaxID=7957 RepID=A0A6P6KY63_CARAU|nr:MARVEL domain-containing protein 2-like isoform X1 [Carassius auratus]XP_026076283.1 MARVEL domain-containing protein 2-like isoform X1 [Carassius auratus]XP_026076284.1 MARVEL domain-containing protein 2-like isoform X1 [Carassius auratus]